MLGKWLDRLLAPEAEKFSAPPPAGHCQDCQKPLLTVLAAVAEGGTAEIRGAYDDRQAARLARLLRWGWPAEEAEALAERPRSEREGDDDRVRCIDCNHYRPGRCGNHRSADLHSPEVGRAFAAMLQRCPGFRPSR